MKRFKWLIGFIPIILAVFIGKSIVEDAWRESISAKASIDDTTSTNSYAEEQLEILKKDIEKAKQEKAELESVEIPEIKNKKDLVPNILEYYGPWYELSEFSALEFYPIDQGHYLSDTTKWSGALDAFGGNIITKMIDDDINNEANEKILMSIEFFSSLKNLSNEELIAGKKLSKYVSLLNWLEEKYDSGSELDEILLNLYLSDKEDYRIFSDDEEEIIQSIYKILNTNLTSFNLINLLSPYGDSNYTYYYLDDYYYYNIFNLIKVADSETWNTEDWNDSPAFNLYWNFPFTAIENNDLYMLAENYKADREKFFNYAVIENMLISYTNFIDRRLGNNKNLVSLNDLGINGRATEIVDGDRVLLRKYYRNLEETHYAPRTSEGEIDVILDLWANNLGYTIYKGVDYPYGTLVFKDRQSGEKYKYFTNELFTGAFGLWDVISFQYPNRIYNKSMDNWPIKDYIDFVSNSNGKGYEEELRINYQNYLKNEFIRNY